MTRYFVLLQLPHSAGEMIRAACFEQLPREAFIPNDLLPITPYEEIGDDFGDLPAFAVVRNPWDWYVAWYDGAMRSGTRAPKIWESAFGGGRSDFRTALIRACTGEAFRSELTEELVRELGIDHYSALHERIVKSGKHSRPVEIGHFERLAEDWGDFLASHGVPIAEQVTESLRRRLATVETADYRARYDEELRGLIATRARRLISEYGYEF